MAHQPLSDQDGAAYGTTDHDERVVSKSGGFFIPFWHAGVLTVLFLTVIATTAVVSWQVTKSSGACSTPRDVSLMSSELCHVHKEGDSEGITGIRYPDTGVCECLPCWQGEMCEHLVEQNEDGSPCLMTVGSGQPHMLYQYWLKHRLFRNDVSWRSNLPLDYRVQYQGLEVYDQHNANGLGGQVNQLIRQLHAKYNNIETDGKYIVFGTGASQLTAAAVHAFGSAAGTPLTLFSRVPHYFSYDSRCRVAGSSTCSHFSANETLDETDVAEIVTIPNNPDGALRNRFYNNSRTWMHDVVYYWPSVVGDPALHMTPLAAPVSLFSFTKLSGHAATRFGWAVVEDKEIADAMYQWIIDVNIYGAIEAVHRASLIFKYLGGEGGDHFFNFVTHRLAERWRLFEEAIATQPSISLRGRPLTQYAWLFIEGKTELELESVFADVGLLPMYGSSFGSPDGFVRFNLLTHEVVFGFVLKRIPLLDI